MVPGSSPGGSTRKSKPPSPMMGVSSFFGNLVNVSLEKEYWIRIISLIDHAQLNPEFVVG